MAVDNKDPNSQSGKFKIKVDGQEVEVSQEEMIELAQKGKDYTKKTQELADKEKSLNAEATRVAGLKSIVDEMEADPKLKETLNKVYSDFKSGKVAKPENKDSNLKKLDRLLSETTDPAQREQLRDIREIIQQEAPIGEVSTLKEEIKNLREEIASVRNAAVIGQTDRIEVQLKKLEEKFGTDLVNKHRKDIVATSLKYPNQSVNKLLYHFADDSELETAILVQSKKREKEELDRKKRGSSPSGTGTSFVAKTELSKDKKTGRITFESLKSRIMERLGR
jgi:hypothetical protein